MGEAVLGFAPQRDSDTSLGLVGAFLALSVFLHGVGFAALSRYAEQRRLEEANRPIELVMFEVEPPKPPPPPPPKEDPKPEPPKPKPPVKVATVEEPPSPKERTPPPPNEPPPPEAAAKPVPLVVGISLSSTTEAGGFAAPVGNTLYGKTSDKAVAPSEVKPYSAPKYTPIYQADTAPEAINPVKIPYPEEARKAGVEGTVAISLTVDLNGNVVGARVLSGPGSGLNEAALEAIRRFKFKPATKNGEAVSTTITWSYRFYLN